MNVNFFGLMLVLLFSMQYMALSAQDRTLKIPLTKGESSETAYGIDGAGMLIVNKASLEEAKQKGQKGSQPGVKIYRVSTQGEKLWDVVSGQQAYKGLLLNNDIMGKIIHSSNFEYTYYACGDQDHINLLQIDDKGQTKVVKAENLVRFNFPHALFCTKKQLGLIVRRSPMGKSETIYTLHTWENDNLNKSEIVLPLPQHSKDSNYDTWSYIGNTEESIFFMSRYNSNKDTKETVKILKMGFDAQVQATFDLEFNINKDLSRFYLPYTRRVQGAAFFETELDGNTLTAIQFDAKSNAIYAWGLGIWADGKKRSEGFYLNKYNLSGQLEWTTQEEIPESITKSGLNKNGTFSYSATALQVNYDQSPSLHLLTLGSIHTIEFYVHGDIKGAFSNDPSGYIGLGDAAFNFVDRDESPGFLFMKKRFVEEAKNKDYTKGSFFFQRFSDGELISEFPKNSDHFNVYWFKR